MPQLNPPANPLALPLPSMSTALAPGGGTDKETHGDLPLPSSPLPFPPPYPPPFALPFSISYYSYESILTTAESIHARLAQNLPRGGGSPGSGTSSSYGAPPRVGLYAAPGPEYLAATWAVWQAGGIVVPLATSHPPPELSYVCQDAGVSVVRRHVAYGTRHVSAWRAPTAQ